VSGGPVFRRLGARGERGPVFAAGPLRRARFGASAAMAVTVSGGAGASAQASVIGNSSGPPRDDGRFAFVCRLAALPFRVRAEIHPVEALIHLFDQPARSRDLAIDSFEPAIDLFEPEFDRVERLTGCRDTFAKLAALFCFHKRFHHPTTVEAVVNGDTQDRSGPRSALQFCNDNRERGPRESYNPANLEEQN
jgi:hypothetical protein